MKFLVHTDLSMLPYKMRFRIFNKLEHAVTWATNLANYEQENKDYHVRPFDRIDPENDEMATIYGSGYNVLLKPIRIESFDEEVKEVKEDKVLHPLDMF